MTTIAYMIRLATITALLCVLQTAAAKAGSIPFQDTWTYDGPQPHGPGGSLLVDHQPHNHGGFASDTMAFQSPGGAIVNQLVADDFTLLTPNFVRRIVFWGYYTASIEPVQTETFQLSIFSSRPTDGLPDVAISQDLAQNPIREWTGRVILIGGNPREFKFTIDLELPFSAEAGQKYWLAVNQVGDPTTTFEWESCATAELNGLAIQNSNYPNWLDTLTVGFPGDSAFQLFSTPEPSTCASLLFGIIGLGCRRCGRRR